VILFPSSCVIFHLVWLRLKGSDAATCQPDSLRRALKLSENSRTEEHKKFSFGAKHNTVSAFSVLSAPTYTQWASNCKKKRSGRASPGHLPCTPCSPWPAVCALSHAPSHDCNERQTMSRREQSAHRGPWIQGRAREVHNNQAELNANRLKTKIKLNWTQDYIIAHNGTHTIHHLNLLRKSAEFLALAKTLSL